MSINKLSHQLSTMHLNLRKALSQRDDMKNIWPKIVSNEPLQVKDKRIYWRAYYQEYSRQYRKQHSKSVRDYQRSYARKHPQQIKSKNHAYSISHAKQRQKYHTNYYRTNAYHKVSHKRYLKKMQNNPEHWRKINAINAARYRRRKRQHKRNKK